MLDEYAISVSFLQENTNTVCLQTELIRKYLRYHRAQINIPCLFTTCFSLCLTQTSASQGRVFLANGIYTVQYNCHEYIYKYLATK